MVATYVDFDFYLFMKKMSETIETKDREQTENFYLLYQQYLFLYMDQFDFEYHPLLLTIKKYISDEAKGAAEENNFPEVKSELEEILTLQKNASGILLEYGVSNLELKQFLFQLRKTIIDCEKNPKAVKNGVANLEKIFDLFLKKAYR